MKVYSGIAELYKAELRWVDAMVSVVGRRWTRVAQDRLELQQIREA